MKNDFTPPVHCWVQWPDWQHPYLTMLTQNIFDKLLISVIMYQHAKNQFIPSVSIFRYSQFSRCITWLATPIFDHVHPKNVQSTLRCVKLYQYAKNHLVPSFLSWDTINFRVSRPDWWHSILTIPCQKLFNQLLIFCEFVSTWKKWDWRNVWFKNPTIWMADSIFAYTSGTAFFPNRIFVQE